jgi:hypothetical protein
MAVIEDHYTFEPTAFENGLQHNAEKTQDLVNYFLCGFRN